jgi:hypothetical protein
LEFHHQSFEEEGCTRRTTWRWEIQTIIQGREEDPEDPTMDYTNTYTDWSGSVEIAMQGAIACICYKYHHRFSSTTPYYQFGERNEEGCAMDRRGLETHSFLRTYMSREGVQCR